jgi:hypothetical protein
MALNGRGGGLDKEFVDERVTYTVNSERLDHYIPRISVAKTSGASGRVVIWLEYWTLREFPILLRMAR